MELSTINFMKVLGEGIKCLQKKISTMAEGGYSLTKTWIRHSTTLIFQHLRFQSVRLPLVEKVGEKSNIGITFTRTLKET